jgi:hypothetical protein
MNTKNKIIAILMASIVAMAVGVPMAMGGDQEAATTASVGNVAPTVDSVSSNPETTVTMDECPTTTLLTITASVIDNNGVGDITSITVAIPGITSAVEMDESCTDNSAVKRTCSKSFALPCCQAPQPYTATVTVTDAASATGTGTDGFTVASTIAMNVTDVPFGSLAVGGSSTVNAVVGNIGNAEIKFLDEGTAGYDDPGDDDIAWSDMTSGENTIEDSQITTTWTPATTITCGNTANVPFTLQVPAGTQTGSYGGTITFTPTA